MGQITTTGDLKMAIQQLEDKQAKEWPLLKEQFLTTYESLKPVNLIKSTFSELTAAPDFKEGIVNTSFSLAAGYLSKKIAVGSTWNPLKQLFGTLLQMGVTNLISNNIDEIKSIADRVLKKTIEPKKV
jgi:hypothetical protein